MVSVDLESVSVTIGFDLPWYWNVIIVAAIVAAVGGVVVCVDRTRKQSR